VLFSRVYFENFLKA
jgi:serine/threonine protein kinase